MRVVLTEAAIDDLIAIGTFIGQDDPKRAATFVAALEARCTALADTPRGFPLLPGREALGIRRRPYGHHLIFYRIDEAASHIEVLRVLSGARNIDAILFPVD
ncbi:type II toxin-antitoxin system RelE/ParE family toxin [Methylobacterium sp. J-076]|uniref:type II toxin-antitoxin system RelE/ParE family toxin n=1 Tax=Methylobacterium sp. J-076 TaxID=2836655 RepID=UPI001FBA1EDC|nr:type II toxin-antitoxin system RelE/ParE family toxin [Methylobacterium sp. J-076]MCJ2014932.1 type II toxin-antitoxin system RelE/ParE family toxin [Methylobacterium sp. J-076]